MVENAFTEAVHESQAVRGGQVDTRLPFVGAVIPERLRRNPVLHERPPALPLDGGLDRSSASVAQIAGEAACIAAGLPSGLAACARATARPRQDARAPPARGCQPIHREDRAAARPFSL